MRDAQNCCAVTTLVARGGVEPPTLPIFSRPGPILARQKVIGIQQLLLWHRLTGASVSRLVRAELRQGARRHASVDRRTHLVQVRPGSLSPSSLTRSTRQPPRARGVSSRPNGISRESGAREDAAHEDDTFKCQPQESAGLASGPGVPRRYEGGAAGSGAASNMCVATCECRKSSRPAAECEWFE